MPTPWCVIDAGSVLDLAWLEDYAIDGAMYVWQGGMESGNAVADVLTGEVNSLRQAHRYHCLSL